MVCRVCPLPPCWPPRWRLCRWRGAAIKPMEGTILLELDHAKQNVLFTVNAPLAEVVEHCRGRLCYLATPYTKRAQFGGKFSQERSFGCAVEAARWLTTLAVEGVTAVSPIVQSVEMISADLLNQQLDPLDQQFWAAWCRPLLRACDVIIVPPIPGWQESEGIWAEVDAALRSYRRVFLIGEGEGGAA